MRGRSTGDARPLAAPASPLPFAVRGLFPSGSPNSPGSIWSTTPHDSAVMSSANLYPAASNRVSPPSMPTYTVGINGSSTLAGSTGFSPATPTRPGGFGGHQRNFSQPVGFGSTSVSDSQGIWSSQASLSSSQSPSQRFPLGTQQTLLNSRNGVGPISSSSSFSQLQQLQLHLQQQQQPLFPATSRNLSSTGYGMPAADGQVTQQAANPWSYSGLDSLSGIGAPLGPFTHQSRLQQQAQIQRSGSWTPT